VTFEFTWTAPRTEGTYYLHAIANAVNRNGGTSGDEWNWLDPIEITVSPSVSVNEPMAAVPAVRLYPVPAHGDVTVSAATLDDVVQVVVTSPTGERVFSTTTASNMQLVEFVWAGRTNDGTPVPPGTYSVAILGRNTRVMGRAVIIR